MDPALVKAADPTRRRHFDNMPVAVGRYFGEKKQTGYDLIKMGRRLALAEHALTDRV